VIEKIPMTVQGAAALKAELHRLKTVDRPKVIEAIASARALGDLKENAEYHAAREQQGFIEARIRELEGKLSHAYVIDVSAHKQDGKVVFGVTVELINVNNDEKVTYTIVGEDEADLKQHKVSVTSPVARALIGKFKGDSVDVKTPAGVTTYEIEAVLYAS